jgi:hypothetical protein
METIPPRKDDEPQRLGESTSFAAELQRLAENAPEPDRSVLLALARKARGEAT